MALMMQKHFRHLPVLDGGTLDRSHLGARRGQGHPGRERVSDRPTRELHLGAVGRKQTRHDRVPPGPLPPVAGHRAATAAGASAGRRYRRPTAGHDPRSGGGRCAGQHQRGTDSRRPPSRARRDTGLSAEPPRWPTGAWGCPPTTPRWPRGRWSRCCGRARPAKRPRPGRPRRHVRLPAPVRHGGNGATVPARLRTAGPQRGADSVVGAGPTERGQRSPHADRPDLLSPPARPEPGPVARRHRCHRPHPRRRDGRRLQRRVRRALLRVPGVAGSSGAPGRVVARDLPPLRGSPGDRRAVRAARPHRRLPWEPVRLSLTEFDPGLGGRVDRPPGERHAGTREPISSRPCRPRWPPWPSTPRRRKRRLSEPSTTPTTTTRWPRWWEPTVGALHGASALPPRWLDRNRLPGFTQADDDGRLYEILDQAIDRFWEGEPT